MPLHATSRYFHLTSCHFTSHFDRITSLHFMPLASPNFICLTSCHFTPPPVIFTSLHATSPSILTASLYSIFTSPPILIASLHCTSCHFTSPHFICLTSCHFTPPPVIFTSLQATSLHLPFFLPHFIPLHSTSDIQKVRLKFFPESFECCEYPASFTIFAKDSDIGNIQLW